MRLGYLLNQYPAISHTFIEREVLALREAGVDVQTFSIHRSEPEHLLAVADREEYDSTYALRPVGPRSLVAAHFRAFASRRSSYLTALVRSLFVGRRGIRHLLWRLFYFLEAVPIWAEMKRSGLRHVHAHFTTPATDVAMIVADLGDSGGRWSWSFTAHGPDIEDTDQQTLATKVRRADRVVCISEFGRSQLKLLVEPEHWPKIDVVHCGIDSRRYPTPRRHRPSASPLHVVNVGRLVPYKGQALLLEAVSLIRQHGVDLLLTIVGDGPLRAPLQERARELGIDDCVAFAGNVGQDDIGSHYAAADIFCLSSLREGIPVVLMEAMATGVPVIATAITGIPELVEDGLSGLLVPPGRTAAIADAIMRLAADEPGRRRLGDAGRARVLAKYEIRDSAGQLAAIFQTCAYPALPRTRLNPRVQNQRRGAARCPETPGRADG